MLDASLLQTLNAVGLDEKEASTYLALLELGRGTATEVAQKSGLKRAIVYHVIDRLKEKGLAQEITTSAIKRFSVVDPIKILQQTQAAAEDMKFMLPLMRSLQNKGRDKPRIEFFEGDEAVLATFHLYEKSTMGRYVTSLDRLHQLFPKEIRAWMERCRSGMIPPKAHHLITNTPIDRKLGLEISRHHQIVRLLPKDVRMDMDFAIMDDLIGITSFDPLFIVVIHSTSIASSAAQLFDLAWSGGITIV